MIIIALIRIAFVELPGHIPDTVWLYLWASVETSLSIIVVSIVAFRALLGHGKSKQKQSPSLQGWKQTNWSPPPLPLVSDTGSDYSHALSGDSRNRSFTVNTSLDFEISGQTKVVEVATIHHHHIYHRRSRLDWMSTFCGLVVTRRAHKINEKRPSRSEAVTPPQVHELEEIHVQELEESCVYELESGIVH